ncbi:hypothetical protein GQ44DRAFT_831141 [Phaeosphaeriaceae sp. PMI808]|nr:hypothetical protein GQ44DRAFT_831141 [Phaeosphaeriaceae sp. PMI808]
MNIRSMIFPLFKFTKWLVASATVMLLLAAYYISGTQLYQYLATAESEAQQTQSRGSLPNNVNKRKRSETPPEEMLPDDEAKYVEQEERAAERADQDSDYKK